MPLKVNIAGYNIDKSLIDSLNDPSATPEVISAAYARISRSEKSITELREEALSEIPKARKSNESIIFEMGHSSIAEHAVFNIDIIGISRLLAETVESIRLASYTEKSQRYVTFEDDFVIPAELANQTQSLQNRFVSMHKKLFEEYKLCYDLLLKYYAKKRLKLTPRELEGKAKEDARYILPLATKTQLGMTINARSLENLLRKLKRTPLAEALEL
ncbi:MAG TPA: FAD-dependent thymidylate synthase, partial [Candidatus Cloacimonadota bacterium]|nr:FAD-dependent thymidylate synthase [Candidatus Cloacimonadota bacterium]